MVHAMSACPPRLGRRIRGLASLTAALISTRGGVPAEPTKHRVRIRLIHLRIAKDRGGGGGLAWVVEEVRLHSRSGGESWQGFELHTRNAEW